MPLSKEELLKPRAILENDYLFNTDKVGTIYSDGDTIAFDTTACKLDCKELAEKYPANFRLLHWSEHRAEGENPDYVSQNGKIIKSTRWRKDGTRFQTQNGSTKPTKGYLPSNEEEYTAYQNTKQNL